MKKISICSPIMNEQECIEEFYTQLKNALDDHDWELVLVDDGSSDNTKKIVDNICAKDERVKFIELSFNHGKARAATTAFNYSKGDYIIYMDTDLQDPPNRILDFCNELDKGYDVIYGIRKERNDNFVRKKESKLFWFLLKKYTKLNIPVGLSVMRAFNKEFKYRLLRMKEFNRFLEGLFFITSGKYKTFEIEHRERFAGRSKFNIQKKLELALNAVLDFSDRPLVWSVKLGFILVGFSIIYFLIILGAFLFGLPVAKGWPSIIGIITFFSGLQTILIGGVGLYVGKTYLESKNRPNVTITSVTNLNDEYKDINNE